MAACGLRAMQTQPATAATLQVEETAEVCRLTLGGRWDLASARPSWHPAKGASVRRVEIVVTELARWDGALVLFFGEVRRLCEQRGWALSVQGLPAGIPPALVQVRSGAARADESGWPWLAHLGLAARKFVEDSLELARFMGNCTIGFVQLLNHPARFRWGDCFAQMQLCGAYGLPIVGLISFLVGVIMAYQSAVLLRQFGADIYVADLIGIGVVREMGPMMAAVVIAGRTGAAFAAEIGNMKANEEIDALETLGIPAVQFLVLPRLLALGVMMPLLALYANALGIFGGLVVAWGTLSIPPTAYWVEMLTIVDLSDVVSGVIKAVAFGLIVGLSGCLRGLQAERSAMGVGRAATSAVVTALLLIIVADALFAVVFNILGI